MRKRTGTRSDGLAYRIGRLTLPGLVTNSYPTAHHYRPYLVECTATVNDTEKYATYTRDSLMGLDYAVSRYYSSQWGRFLSPDPSARSIALQDPGTWNRLVYVSNDPINEFDPQGLEGGSPPCDCCWWPGPRPGPTGPMPCFQVAPGVAVGPIGRPCGPPRGGGVGGTDARINGELHDAYNFAEWLLANSPDCARLMGQGTVANGATVTAAEVLTDLMSGTTYGSITVGPIPLGSSNLIVNASTTLETIASQSGATQIGALITINDGQGDYVSGDPKQQAVTLLHELGHAMNGTFGPGTSGITTDSISGNGPSLSHQNIETVEVACINLFSPPPPVLLGGRQ